MDHPRPTGRRPSRIVSFAHLPREVIRNIAGWIYDPLDLTQQDRLTWGIFSTVDMHQQRQDDLESLVRFGWTCRRVRREVRVILFRCIRTPTKWHAEEVVRNALGWAKYVKSIIVDLSMFDLDDNDSDSDTTPPLSPRSQKISKPSTRSCWGESTTLIHLFNALPSLEHVSFFADASDDSTLALTFASWVPHPSSFPIPPSTLPPSPAISTRSIIEPPGSPTSQDRPIIPIAHRLRSFGWRQRASPPSPSAYRKFHQSTSFVSTLHVLRHAYQLSFLVLDADMDAIHPEDLQVVLKELSLREAPIGEQVARVSLMLCGPIVGWLDHVFLGPGTNGGFMRATVNGLSEIQELFLDRPLAKSTNRHIVTETAFLDVLKPLFYRTPHLNLLQVGSYNFPRDTQISIARSLAEEIPSLVVLGLNGEEGDTTWWGIWRGPKYGGFQVRPLGDGDLRRLEYGQAGMRRMSVR